jgi:hypothetical protein
MNITVFGGSLPQPGSDAYVEAYQLGRSLAEAGHDVLTGGYIGTMEAVSRGAAEAGGHVIGVTCNEIERWRSVKPNSWVQEERRCATLEERMQSLIAGCDAAIALPGGPGTLAEVSLTWNLNILGTRPRVPLVLVGKGWTEVMEQFLSSMGCYISESQKCLLVLVPDIHAAVLQLPHAPLDSSGGHHG